MSSSASTSSTFPLSWQEAWLNAQPRLAQIRDSSLSTPPAARIIRVGQLDAELLDQELVQLLKEPLVKALNLVNSVWKARFEPELVLIIQLMLYKFTVWNLGTSYGAKLQGLGYATGKVDGSPTKLSRQTLVAHGALTLLIPYIHNRVRAHALSRAWPDAPSTDRRRRAWELLTRLESVHALFGLLNFIAFLWDGRYRTTVDRLLKMRLVSARRLARRDVSYEFMNRQMVWHAFTEFLLFLLPLINTRALRRRIVGVTSQLTPSSVLPKSVSSLLGLSKAYRGQSSARVRRGNYWALSQDQCAICAENASTNLNFSDSANALTSFSAVPAYANASGSSDTPNVSSGSDAQPPAFPIHNPYITSCGHVYCYYCISERMLRTADERSGVGSGGTQWECLRCTEGVSGADRLEAQAEGPEYESGVEDEDEFEFEYGSSEDMGFTDMSGSIGSYSESGSSE